MPPELPPDLARLLHDLRGPLNSLTVHAELLKGQVGADALADRSVRTIIDQLNRLSGMLADAFGVVSLELGRLQPVDLGAVVAAAGRELGATVAVDQTAWPTVTGDAALLSQAIVHLLRNALESGDGGRPPLVSAAAEGAQTLLRVRDWGAGLRATDPRIVIRAWHSPKPGRKGLGLVTVERIARLHGGTLRFESPPGGGALVTLVLLTGGTDMAPRPPNARAAPAEP
jgi:signal transduction histidine kinase